MTNGIRHDETPKRKPESKTKKAKKKKGVLQRKPRTLESEKGA